MSRPIYPALVGEGARLARSKTGDNQQRDDQRHEAGSSHEGTSRLMIEITNVTWDGNATARPPGRAAAVHQCRLMGWPGRAPALQDLRSCGGIKKHKEHVPCHANLHHPPSARSASISVRIA